VILFRNWPQVLNISELILFKTDSFLLQSVRVSAQIQTLDPQSPSSNLQMADQDQAFQVNFIPLRSIQYYFFDSHLKFFSSAFSR
jgi:hypothetical protein